MGDSEPMAERLGVVELDDTEAEGVRFSRWIYGVGLYKWPGQPFAL